MKKSIVLSSIVVLSITLSTNCFADASTQNQPQQSMPMFMPGMQMQRPMMQQPMGMQMPGMQVYQPSGISSATIANTQKQTALQQIGGLSMEDKIQNFQNGMRK
jgi:hypothetical protein